MPRRPFRAAAAGALLLGLAACGDPGDGPASTAPPPLGIEAPSDGGGDAGPSDGGGDAGPSDGGGNEAEPATNDAPDIPPPDPADYAGMDENTPEGAEQAFRYYIAVSMWAHQVGDDSATDPLEGESCGGCIYLNEDIPDALEADLLWSSFEIDEVGLEARAASKYEQEVRYKFTLSSHQRPDDTFANYIEVESLDYDSVGGMEWEGSQWVVGEMSVEWGEDVH